MRRILGIAMVLLAGVVCVGQVRGGPVAGPAPSTAGERIVIGATSPERIVVVDVDRGVATSRRVPGGTLCHGKLAVTGGRVVVSDGFPGLVALPIQGAGPSRRLGVAHHYFESETPGRIWATRMRYGADPAITSLRELTVDGRRTFSTNEPDLPSLTIAGAFDGGLVFHSGRGLRIHDSRHPERDRRAPGEDLVAVGGSRLVACDRGCRRLRVSTAAAGSTDALRIRAAVIPSRRGVKFAAGGGEVSPDGSQLAVAVELRGAARLAVVGLATGDLSVVPGGPLAPHGPLAWSQDGDRVFFAAPSGSLRAYRPAAREVEALPVRVHGNVVDMATG